VKPIAAKAEELAQAYRSQQSADPALAHAFVLTDVIAFVLRQQGHSWAEYGWQVRDAGYDIHSGLRLLPDGAAAATAVDTITGQATPFLAHFDDWKPNAGLKPRPLDQAIATLKEFAGAVRQPIERLEAKHVQAWIDRLIDADGTNGLTAATVGRKLSEVRNYWRYLQSRQIVPEDKLPFANRRVKDPAARRKTKDEKRQRFSQEDVVRLWQAAELRGDLQLSTTIKIAAHSGARIEGVVQLKASDIRRDPETDIRYMKMTDKSAAGDRYIPIHPAIGKLLDEAVRNAGSDGYLIRSAAENKYHERSQPIGKRFGRLKSELGFDGRYVFHSIRKTVAAQFQDANCPESVAADVIGHTKPTMTYGLYGGLTRMDLRSSWLAKAICYPSPKDHAPAERATAPRSISRSARRPSTGRRGPVGS
jgi:integrase